MFKIKGVQLDVNGLCNAGCWFCPVRYEGNPKSAITDMPLDKLENILKQLSEGKGDFVDNDLNLIYTANYNEVILYKHFEEMFDLYRKYGFKINQRDRVKPIPGRQKIFFRAFQYCKNPKL